jgi:hypothetical protein
MLSIWEKIHHPFSGPELTCQHRSEAPWLCGATAFWSHRWKTEDMDQEHFDYYCEAHALEHGLSNYQLIRDSPEIELQVSSGDPPGTIQYLGLDLETGAELTLHEQQAQETLIPYGGSGAEEATMFEDEEEDE